MYTRKLLIPLGNNTTRSINVSDNKENIKSTKGKVGSIKYSRCSIPSTKFLIDKRTFGKNITNIILHKDNLKCSLSHRNDSNIQSNNNTNTLSKARSKDTIFPPVYDFNKNVGLRKNSSLRSLKGTTSNNIIADNSNNGNNSNNNKVISIRKESINKKYHAGIISNDSAKMIKPRLLANIQHNYSNSNEIGVLIPNIRKEKEKNITNEGMKNEEKSLKVDHAPIISHDNNNNKPKKPIRDYENLIKTSILSTEIITPPRQSLSLVPITNDNPQLVNEYRFEIYTNLLDEERHIQFPINSTYMNTQNKEINSQMRSILVDWLIEIHDKFTYSEEALFLSISILDRYLSRKNITRDKFQLVGVASLYIACKHEEIELPNPKEFVYITDKAFNEKELYQMEYDILKALQFTIMLPTSLRFYEYLSVDFGLNKEQDCLGRYALNCALIDYDMIRYNNSEIACACLYLTMKYFDMSNYGKLAYIDCSNASISNSCFIGEGNKEYCNQTKGIDDKDKDCNRLNKCIVDVEKMFDKYNESSEFKATKKKFLHKKYSKISIIYQKKKKGF